VNTHRTVDTTSHITELATLASICTEPSNIQRTYAEEKSVVQTELNKNKIKLTRLKSLVMSKIRKFIIHFRHVQRVIAFGMNTASVICTEEEGDETHFCNSHQGDKQKEERVIMSLQKWHAGRNDERKLYFNFR
jgi:hypothetical protein